MFQLKELKKHNNKIALYCYDCWEPEFEEWRKVIDEINPEYLFFAYKLTNDYYRENGYNSYWSPLAADYEVFKYENKKKAKENIKKQRSANLDIKEYRLSVAIDIHDFNTRVKNSSKYLEKGHRVKASIRFRGREMAHTELGRDVLYKFAEALKDVADIEQKPILDGRNMTMMLMPKKEK